MKNKQSGFTLIEIIVYIALFSIIIMGCFITAFGLIEGFDRLSSNATVQEEGNFVTRKIDWILTGMNKNYPQTISGTGCFQTLTTFKVGFMYPFSVTLQNAPNSPIEMSSIAPYAPLTTANVKVSCLRFIDTPPNGNAPEGITAIATINNHDFTITKYIRK